MKAILMSIKPQHVANILNGLKTIEIRKKFPSDYVGWVYIYCTKDQNEELWWYDGTEDFRLYKKGIANEKDIGWHLQNGKVVARFWCDKVGRISSYPYGYEMYLSGSILTRDIQVIKENEICEKACLTKQELRKYIPCDKERYGYAIHITNLEIFEKPKELNEFYKSNDTMKYIKSCWENYGLPDKDDYDDVILTRAPQSWQYIEV